MSTDSARQTTTEDGHTRWDDVDFHTTTKLETFTDLPKFKEFIETIPSDNGGGLDEYNDLHPDIRVVYAFDERSAGTLLRAIAIPRTDATDISRLYSCNKSVRCPILRVQVINPTEGINQSPEIAFPENQQDPDESTVRNAISGLIYALPSGSETGSEIKRLPLEPLPKSVHNAITRTAGLFSLAICETLNLQREDPKED